jgi:DNA polymerase
MHNLPRASVTSIEDWADKAGVTVKELKENEELWFEKLGVTKQDAIDPDYWISRFNMGFDIPDPVGIAKALIRPMITAPPGYTIAVADYSSIENRILAWAADDTQTLEDFNHGLDQYVTMAAARFGVPYAEITAEQRRVGKVIILGCGFGMGGKKFKTTAAVQAGLDLSDEESKASVDAYRNRYPLVKSLWAHLRNAAAEAVISGSRRRYKNTTFGVFSRNGVNWLALQLPTGKSLYYMNPTIKDEFIPDYEYMGSVATITHSGINPYTKKWSRLKLIPGRITENLVQGTAREVMAYGMLNVQKFMPQFRIIGSVHDEALALVRDEDATLNAMTEFTHRLCDVNFLPGCPIKAVGFFTRRYKKG